MLRADEDGEMVEKCLLNGPNRTDIEKTCQSFAVANERSNGGRSRKRRKILEWTRLSTIPKRYYVTLLLLMTTIMEGYVLTNMGVVVVDINSNKTVALSNGTEIVNKAEHNWTPMERGIVLGMNSVGQILACVSGAVVHRIGGATFLGVGKLGEAIITLTSPFVINTHVYQFIAHRLLLGMFEGLTYVGTTDVLAHWTPPKERVRLSTFVSLGYGIGIAANYPISGFIIHHFGWEVSFYILGAVILTWSVIWMVFVTNDPSTNRFVSEQEKNYLAREINFVSRKEIVVPYKDILTSVPVYALLNEFFISGFTSSFVMLIPLYVKDIYNVDIQTIGFISCIPELTNLVVRAFSAYLIDNVRSKPNGYGIGKTHKLVVFWGQFFTLVFFLIAALWNGLIVSIICLTLARVSYGISSNSYYVITIDFGGQYAGFLQSMAQMSRSLTYFLNPQLIGLMIRNHKQSEWNAYFLVISFLTMYGVIVFVIFGSGDLQPWAEVRPKSNVTNDTTNNEHDDEVATSIERTDNSYDR